MEPPQQAEGDSSNPPTEAQLKAQDFKASGNLKFNANDYRGAAADYVKGLQHDMTNPDLHSNLSAAYIYLEKFIEAEEHASYTIFLKPNFYKGYMRAAKAAHGRGHTRVALRKIREGLAKVTDTNGIKELRRLKNQYMSFMALPVHNEEQMKFEMEPYESEDEDPDVEEQEPGEDSDSEHSPPEDEAQVLPPMPQLILKCPPLSPAFPLVAISAIMDSDLCSVEPCPPFLDEEFGSVAKRRKIICKVKASDIRKRGTNTEQSSSNSTSTASKSVSLPEADTSVKEVDALKESAVQETANSKTIPDDGSKSVKQPIAEAGVLETCNFTEIGVLELKESLKSGSEAYLTNNFRRAVECFKLARERVGLKPADYEMDERQLQVIKYALCASLISLSTYEDIVKGIQGLDEMKAYEESIPALHIQAARAYFKLNRFKAAIEPLDKVQEILEKIVIFPTFTWPGTNESILETTPTGLKDAIKELNQLCRMPHKPTAMCRYDQCLKISTHILPSECIYSSDPDFIGFVHLTCQEKCHIEYHIACWKSYKESVRDIGKLSDKDFLGLKCLTQDCVTSSGEPSLIITIEVIGPDGTVKNSNRLDKTTAKHLKKKKTKFDSKTDSKAEDAPAAKAPKPKKVKEQRVKEKKAVESTVEKTMDVEKTVESTVEKTVESTVQKTMDVEKTVESTVEKTVDVEKIMDVEKTVDVENTVDVEGEEAEDDDDDDDLEEMDPVVWWQICQELLITVREEHHGIKPVNWYDPRLNFYGRPDETLRATNSDFLDKSNTDSVEVKDAKEFLFSYFQPIFKDEGPLKFLEVETLWKEAAGDFCDMKVMLPNLTSMKDLLLESMRFCAVDNYLCLSDQLQEAYALMSEAYSESMPVLLQGLTTEEASATEATKSDDERAESSSEEDSDTEEYNSSDDSEEEGSDEEEEYSQETSLEMQFPAASVAPKEKETVNVASASDSKKISLQEMLAEMNRLKVMFMPDAKPEDPGTEEVNTSVVETSESTSNETFETAHSSMDREKLLDEVVEEKTLEELISDEDTTEPNSTGSGGTGEVVEALLSLDKVCLNKDATVKPDADEVEPEVPTDKASQSEVTTEERDVQTIVMETKDSLSQTKESELYQELRSQITLVNSENDELKKTNAELSKLVEDKNKAITVVEHNLQKAQEAHKKELGALRHVHTLDKKEFERKESAFLKKEAEQKASMEKMKQLYSKVNTEVMELKREKSELLKENTEAKLALNIGLIKTKEVELHVRNLEKNMKSKMQRAQQAQLQTTKEFWESQVNLLKKRCVEKISEVHAWFSMFPSEEVEELPSWALIHDNMGQWTKISKQVKLIEAEFLVKYKQVEARVMAGEEVHDLREVILPSLPEEPKPLPLDKIHREITEKHLKRISDLTQLVAKQQLDIEKSKDMSQQFTQLMNNFQMGMNMNTPRQPSTAFGGLAMHMSQLNVPPPTTFNPLTTPPPPAVLTPTAGSTNPNNEVLKTSPLLPDSTTLGLTFGSLSTVPPVKEDGLSSTYPFLLPPPPVAKSTVSSPPTALTLPPPPIGVAQNILKNGSVLAEKKEASVERKISKTESKASSSSRETTPAPTSAPTPEKTGKKKKKKNKSEPVPLSEPQTSTTSVSDWQEPAAEAEDWCVVVSSKSSAPKPVMTTSTPAVDSRLKNRKRLMDKLQGKFPHTTFKDLDEVVKLVRDQNNGSLSGLPFDVIEDRVEHILAARHFKKNSTMGLERFSELAWGNVRNPETNTNSNLKLDECCICLEPMEGGRTKIVCGHEFHTECLRKWLRESSVCPLCNKFTTMPDEFPAL